MKKSIKAYFIPHHYACMILRKFDTCRQGKKSVKEYEYQLRSYRCRAYFVESDEEVILGFMKGLRCEIKERISSQSLINYGYWEVVKIALRVEL